jgi:putative oxidoreductase
MKIVSIFARYLLGLIFVFFGSNVFFHFLKTPMPPAGSVLGQFEGALAASHYLYVVAFFQVVPGLFLLAGRYIPLALTFLAPVIFNIIVTHVTMAPSGLPMAALVTILWFLVFARVHTAFHGLFQAKVD